MKICQAPECKNPSRARGYCVKHYQQVKKLGELRKPFDRRCSVEGCSDKHNSLGFCNRHYLQFRRFGKVISDRSAIAAGGVAKIPLGYGAKQGYALVDIEDMWVDRYYWNNHHGYAEGQVEGRHNSMHRLIMSPPPDMQVDHISHDRLDNRRSNLRICTKTENKRNSGKRMSNTTGYKGVVKAYGGKYVAKLGYNGKKLHLGTYDDPKAAARAYDEKAKELHGDFASLNNVDVV